MTKTRSSSTSCVQGTRQSPSAAPNAQGRVKIESVGPVEIMDVKVRGLPPNTDFDFFVIQVPKAPFGLAWYQGDIETTDTASAMADSSADLVSRPSSSPPASPPLRPCSTTHRFRMRTKIPRPLRSSFTTWACGSTTRMTRSAQASQPAVTPFNGEHNAGPQVLNTSQFPLLITGPFEGC